MRTDVNNHLISLHKLGDDKEAYLLVNVGEDFIGDIRINPILDVSNTEMHLYNPHTDAVEPVLLKAAEREVCVQLSIPSEEARILFI